MEFSVLISVYQRENPLYLKQALDSLYVQIVPPSEVVIVEDGPLTDGLHTVINAFSTQHPTKIVRLPHNQGLGKALREGLKHCRFPIVARMDSDDICMSRRFEKQLSIMENTKVDIVGSWIDEFSGSKKHVVSTRKVPEFQAEILRFARHRNPMNHPTVMFRKQVIEAISSYQDLKLFEDYDLWVRALQAGATFYNLQESLLWFRLSPEAFQRRGGLNYIKKEIRFQRRLHRYGFIGLWNMLQNIFIRSIIRLLPNKIRKYIYIFSIHR